MSPHLPDAKAHGEAVLAVRQGIVTISQMGSLRIKGVVALAASVRRALASPMSPSRRGALRGELADSLAQIEGILRRHGNRIEDVPASTRQAYHFLRTVDLSATEAVTMTDAPPVVLTTGTFRIPGIKAVWDRLLGRLAAEAPAENRNETFRFILSTVDDINTNLRARGLTPDDLNALSRTVHAAMMFLAERTSFDQYTAAIDRARPAFEAAIRRSRRYVLPVHLEFRPQAALYRVRGFADATRVMLPLAMIVFTPQQFDAMARAVIAGGDKKPVLDAAGGEAYQSLQAQVEAFSGTRDIVAGIHHDLGHSFDRINAEYFEGDMPRPRLTWSDSAAARRLGHYDLVRDKVTISRSLDAAGVPTVALDFVVYHELLHKALGIEGRNGRLHAHTSEFRKHERQFMQLAEAEAALKKIGTRPTLCSD